MTRPTKPTIWERVEPFLRDVMVTVREANVPGLASQVAYSLIFAMPSILLIVTLIAGQVDRYTGFAITAEVRHAIITTLPPDVQQVMIGLLDDAMLRARAGPTTVSAIVSILVAMVMAGNGLAELSVACCTAAGIVDTRPEWLKRVIFTSTSVLIALVLIGAFALFFWGGDLVMGIGGYFGAGQSWAGIWRRLQLPVLVLIVFLGLTLLFMTSTGHYVFWHVAPGALIATLLWFLEVWGFQIYLHFANPGTAYGAASSVLVFLVFLYVSAVVLIFGGMIAAVIGREIREGAFLLGMLPRQIPMRRTAAATAQRHDSSSPTGG